MGSFDAGNDAPTHTELAWELAEVFEELDVDQINEVLAKNVPFDTLEFFVSYAEGFANDPSIDDGLRKRLANLMLLGYLLRILEERLLPDAATES